MLNFWLIPKMVNLVSFVTNATNSFAKVRKFQENSHKKGLTSGLASVKQNIKSIESRMSKEVMEQVEVICATCIGAAAELLEDYTFPVVLIDGKCFEMYVCNKCI
jgi:hypothetical protein